MEDQHHAALSLPANGSSVPLPPRAHVRKHVRRALWVIGLLLMAGAARTLVAAVLNHNRLNALTTQNARKYVNVVRPRPTDGTNKLTLPGTLRGYIEAPIYARASGYLLHWYADIGASVKQGQLLAELDTPELNQELAQAVAQRRQAASTLTLAKISFDRAQQLRTHDAVSQQELDERQGAYQQNTANVAAADANVRRLNELKSFQRITAPITGIVTQRNVDVGDLVNAGNGGAGRTLFTLVQADRLRLYVAVPQAYAQPVRTGQHVSITQTELPGVTFDGTITHTAQAIDVGTRSLQIEIVLPNGDHQLMPGAYVQATLPMAPLGQLLIPANTLLFRAEGPRVAVVGANGRVQLRAVSIARSLGQTVEIDHGLSVTDQIVLNPSDSLADGDTVIVAAPHADAVTGTRP